MNTPNILQTWLNLKLQQQIVVVGSTLAMVACCVILFNYAGKEGDALLFAGLEDRTAGEITAELDGLGVEYSVRGSGIYVPASQRDRLRLDLARAGLPGTTTGGYELLDTMNGFSTTADMFDANYWRAKEGELTRTIVAIPSVRAARVHLGVNRQSPFRRRDNQGSASVTVEAPGGLSRDQAESIQFLTALAVANLSPDQVAVIDTQRGVIAGPGSRNQGSMGTDVETRSRALETNLTQMLEAHVGLDNARVSVAMDIERQTIAQTERLIDPETRQIASRSISEERDTEDRAGGPVTIASQLPDGNAEQDADAEAEDLGPVLRLRRDEDVVYTGTEIERVTQQAPGAIRRLSIAIMINEPTMTDEEGNILPDPRSEEEMAALESLVSSAAGLDLERGDTLTIRSLPFEARPVVESMAPSFIQTQIMPRAVDIAQTLIVSLVAIVLGLFVVKPLLSPKAPEDSEEGALGEDGARALPADAASLLAVLTEENPDDAAAILDAWFEEETQAA